MRNAPTLAPVVAALIALGAACTGSAYQPEGGPPPEPADPGRAAMPQRPSGGELDDVDVEGAPPDTTARDTLAGRPPLLGQR
jgi:hypothetical protein